MGTRWVILSVFYLSPLCHGHSLGVSFKLSFCLHHVTITKWECLDNCLFVSIISLRVACQSSICLHDGMGAH